MLLERGVHLRTDVGQHEGAAAHCGDGQQAVAGGAEEQAHHGSYERRRPSAWRARPPTSAASPTSPTRGRGLAVEGSSLSGSSGEPGTGVGDAGGVVGDCVVAGICVVRAAISGARGGRVVEKDHPVRHLAGGADGVIVDGHAAADREGRGQDRGRAHDEGDRLPLFVGLEDERRVARRDDGSGGGEVGGLLHLGDSAPGGREGHEKSRQDGGSERHRSPPSGSDARPYRSCERVNRRGGRAGLPLPGSLQRACPRRTRGRGASSVSALRFSRPRRGGLAPSRVYKARRARFLLVSRRPAP